MGGNIMNIDEIKQELIEQGKSPDDFNIEITESGHSVTPKWFYESKQIAKKEDVKFKNEVAFNSAMSNLESLQLTENIKNNLELAQAEANYELMMLIITMGGN